MSSGIRLPNYTYADYLAHEEASNVKHEYLDGEIYAMAGRLSTPLSQSPSPRCFGTSLEPSRAAFSAPI